MTTPYLEKYTLFTQQQENHMIDEAENEDENFLRLSDNVLPGDEIKQQSRFLDFMDSVISIMG